MSLREKKVEELKEMCKQKKISGYSKLKKEDLIKILSKKKGGNFNISINNLNNSVKSLVQNIKNKDEYFIAYEDDNKGLFNKNNNTYYKSIETFAGNNREFKEEFIVNCKIKGLKDLLKVKTKKLILTNLKNKFIIIEGEIVKNNIENKYY